MYIWQDRRFVAHFFPICLDPESFIVSGETLKTRYKSSSIRADCLDGLFRKLSQATLWARQLLVVNLAWLTYYGTHKSSLGIHRIPRRGCQRRIQPRCGSAHFPQMVFIVTSCSQLDSIFCSNLLYIILLVYVICSTSHNMSHKPDM